MNASVSTQSRLTTHGTGAGDVRRTGTSAVKTVAVTPAHRIRRSPEVDWLLIGAEADASEGGAA
jgi:hypothetical protein